MEYHIAIAQAGHLVRLSCYVVALVCGAALVGCQQRSPLSREDAFVLEQDFHCDLHGRPTPEGEAVGLLLTDCDQFDERADEIRARRSE